MEACAKHVDLSEKLKVQLASIHKALQPLRMLLRQAFSSVTSFASRIQSVEYAESGGGW